jgi:hypothetical protein
MRKISDSIRRGLQEAVAYAKGGADKNAYRVHVPEQIRHSGQGLINSKSSPRETKFLKS